MAYTTDIWQESTEIHLEHRNHQDNIPCLYCEKPTSTKAVKCLQCKVVSYCDNKCLLGHWTKHQGPCDQYRQHKSKCAGNSGFPTASQYKKEERYSKDKKKKKTCSSKEPTARRDESKPMPECSFCDKRSFGLRKCSQCHLVSYCDADCQRKHWSQHKKACKKTAPKTPKAETTIRCSSCNKPNTATKKCSRCMDVSYCDAVCQRQHWPQHKVVCGGQVTNGADSDAGSKSLDDVVKAKPEEGHEDTVKAKPEEGHEDTVKAKPGEPQGDTIRCFSCKKVNPKAKKCTKCSYAAYCDLQCQRNDFPQHKVPCGNYPRFVEALGRADPLLSSLHDRDVTDLLFPPRIFTSLSSFANPGRKACLMEIVGPYHHFCKTAVYLRDVKGVMTHMIFHNKPDEQILLLPATLKDKLQAGNFIRWFYPRWHRFFDGEIAFRVDSLNELEFVPKQMMMSFFDV